MRGAGVDPTLHGVVFAILFKAGVRRQSGSKTRVNAIRKKEKPRNGAALYSDPDRSDQRVTVTVVPTETRWYRSVMSALSMRMQP